MIILSTKNADFPESTEMNRETRDFNVGYGDGVISNPSDQGTFKQDMTTKMLNWISLLGKRRHMIDALDFLKPSEGMSDWTGDAQSPPLRTPNQKRSR